MSLQFYSDSTIDKWTVLSVNRSSVKFHWRN